MTEEGYSTAAAAKAVGVSQPSLKAWVAKFGPPPKEPGNDASLEDPAGEQAAEAVAEAGGDRARNPKKSHDVLRAGVAVKHAWMADHRDSCPVTVMCHVLDVSTPDFYESLKRLPSQRAERSQRIREAVRQVHAESHGTYGSEKIAIVLEKQDGLERAGVTAGFFTDFRGIGGLIALRAG